MAVAKFLVDKSVLSRSALPQVRRVLEPLVDAGRAAICGMTALELGFSARHFADHGRIGAGVAVHEWLHTEDADFSRAFAVQAELARTGRHRAVSLPDLLLGAMAERHRVALLHYDADFALIGQVTGQPTQWVVPRGSVD